MDKKLRKLISFRMVRSNECNRLCIKNHIRCPLALFKGDDLTEDQGRIKLTVSLNH